MKRKHLGQFKTFIQLHIKSGADLICQSHHLILQGLYKDSVVTAWGDWVEVSQQAITQEGD